MNATFEVWESTEARDLGYPRDRMYQLVLRRDMRYDAGEGAKYGEDVNPPCYYKDRDAIDEEATYQLHCRLINEIADSTISDFSISLKLADISEKVM
jgi:hypothetical protein